MGLLPDKFDNYVRFFKFILKYRNDEIFSDEIGELNSEELKDYKWEHSPEELVVDLKEMGPTYIKLGQLLSTRSDMLPDPFLKALSSLQDDVEGISFEEVQELFELEIGTRISKAFLEFDPKPLASASIGQVHKAILHSGKAVAVKIQRPEIKKRFINDLDVLLTISEKAESYNEESQKFGVYEIVEELRYILLQELDYESEARNLKLLKENMKVFSHLFVPGVIDDYSSKKILTMDFIEGDKVTNLSPFQLQRLPTNEIVDDFVKGYLHQVIVDGFAHADPHPGNIHVMKSGKLAMMDLGMVAQFDDTMKENILKLMIGLGENDGDEVYNVLLAMSTYDAREANLGKFKRDVLRQMQRNQNRKASDLQNGRTIMEINKHAALCRVKLPVELVSLGKILLNLDQIIAILSPDYDLQERIRTYVEELMHQHMKQQLKAGDLLRSLLESKQLMEKLPYRLNKISEDLAAHRFKIQMDIFDERRFILALQKVANRITTAIIVAALILGAALIMRIPTRWTIYGYPGFAVILFIIAALIGFYLVYQILFKDEEESN